MALTVVSTVATGAMAELRGEIRIVKSWRPDISVLGHNVLQYLYEYALERNELVPCLAVSHRWEALSYAVNKEDLLKYAFKGNAEPMRGVLTEMSGVDLSDTEPYNWNVSKARELLEEAGYGKGFKMKLFYHGKDYLIAQFLKRFYRLLEIEVEITPVEWEWIVKHVVYPNTQEDYSWKNEDWWMIIISHPTYVPELMDGLFEWGFHIGAPWQTFPDWLIEPLDSMHHEIRRTKDREKRFQIYKKANEYIADQALWVSTMASLGLYGANMELEFVPHVSQYLYLDYSSVTDRHWSIRGRSSVSEAGRNLAWDEIWPLPEGVE
jgi:ABC-type transport system substrate-binding protein